jgi:hypothetical protein
MSTGAGGRLYVFCSLSCFERYPLDACASMATRDLVYLVSTRRPKTVTDGIKTRQDLEAVAVAVIREEAADVMNLNPKGHVPALIATRRGADKSRSYPAERVEPEGVAPVKALAAERAYILALGGGTHMLPESLGGFPSMAPELAATMAGSIMNELPGEAMETLANMLGDGTNARKLMAQLGGPQAAEAHDRVFAPQLGSGTDKPKR